MHPYLEAVLQERPQHHERAPGKAVGPWGQIALSYVGNDVEMVRIKPARAADDLLRHQNSRRTVREANELS